MGGWKEDLPFHGGEFKEIIEGKKVKIQILYILDCPWCLKTKEVVREVLRELGVKAEVEEILIDTEEKAKEYGFLGSPTVLVDGRDVQEEVTKGRCPSCEELAESAGHFVRRECKLGCRVYFYGGRHYPYPPKRMIKKAVEEAMGHRESKAGRGR